MGAEKKVKKRDEYKKFDTIDGSHPLKKAIPEGYIDYPARIRKGGKVSYFNFELAIKLGLISSTHSREVSLELEEKLLKTFSIQIINEYDQMKERTFPSEEMKQGAYMATRYLQLQHPDKKGKGSGDGRSVWNGQVSHKNKSWDISSCGTGGTCLSPATSKYNKFFETGDPSISYGCGYAELDEGLCTAILSKVFELNNHSSEETLVIIEFKNKISINVRAHENLLRPSHIFLHLKQDNLESLTSIVDYYIDKQREREDWQDCPKGRKKYDYALKRFMCDFARLSANFEDEYIFCWLEWDGDNILMDGGIIDYGSIRQFGLFHYEYRYDDVERFSTNILEQRNKAKYMVQTFVQAIEYISCGTKQNIQDFSSHPILQDFDHEYNKQKNKNILHRLGLTKRRSAQLLKRAPELVSSFRKAFTYFEQAKSEKGLVKISDGVTWDAIFSMRNLLREYPQIYQQTGKVLEIKDFFNIMLSQFANEKDKDLSKYRKHKIGEFQKSYIEIVHRISDIFQEDIDDTLQNICARSLVINKADRITGDAVTHIVDLIVKNRKKLNPSELLELIDSIVISQNLDPDKKNTFLEKHPTGLLKKSLQIIKDCKEGI